MNNMGSLHFEGNENREGELQGLIDDVVAYLNYHIELGAKGPALWSKELVEEDDREMQQLLEAAKQGRFTEHRRYTVGSQQCEDSSVLDYLVVAHSKLKSALNLYEGDTFMKNKELAEVFKGKVARLSSMIERINALGEPQ